MTMALLLRHTECAEFREFGPRHPKSGDFGYIKASGRRQPADGADE